jgi:alpha-L-rhamnosidase
MEFRVVDRQSLDAANWQADWITPDWDEDASWPQPAPLLRRSFVAADGLVAARLYATSLGLPFAGTNSTTHRRHPP